MKKHFQVINYILMLVLAGGFLALVPGQAPGAEPFTVDKITISKEYNSIEIPDAYYLTIEGTYLEGTTVRYLDPAGKLITLTNPVGGDGIKQYTIAPEKIGQTLFIEAPGLTKKFDISESNMSRLKSLNSKSIKAGTSVQMEVTNGEQLGDTLGEYKAYYYDQINQVDISAALKNGTNITVNNTGIYNIRFERNFTSNGTPVNIAYRYLNIFRVYDVLDGVSPVDSITMFPNRGEPGSTVYFRANDLKQDMSVFFLKKDDGTDSFTQANKGVDFTYQKDAEGNIDIVTVKIPAGLTPGEEYFVYFTNKVNDTVDPMKYVFKQLPLKQKFMVINVGDKVQVFNISPNSGPDTGQSIEIMGRYLGTLNITGLNAAHPLTNDSISFSADGLQAVINYGDGTYAGSPVEGITKTIRVYIANSASFETGTKNAGNFSKDVDRIYVKTPPFPIMDGKNITCPVEIRTVTSFTKGGIKYTYEELTSYSGFTFIPSMSKPMVDRITPDKIQIEQTAEPAYAVKNDTLFAIYGQNFKIYRETQNDGSSVVRYPVVRILKGESPEIEINMNTGKILDYQGHQVPGAPEMYIFDAGGNLLDGSAGKQTGVKILLKLPHGIKVNHLESASSPRSVRVINPIKNSAGEGLEFTLEDKLSFVMTNQDPVISSVVPDVVTVQGGEDVTISGGNFRNGVKVIIDGQEVNAITRDGSGQKITFKAPPGRPGVTQMAVLNPEGGMAAWPFTYVTTYTEPKLISFSPASGNTGTLVVVKGENFLTPDPTASPGEVSRLIGTRVLLGTEDINDYHRDAFNQIELRPYSNDVQPVLSSSGSLASYYHSVVFADSDNKYYVLQQQDDGKVKLCGGTDNNSYIIIAQDGHLTARKINGGDLVLTVQPGGLNLNGLALTMLTPYVYDANGNITGNRVQVINNNEIRFTVPILPADGYYDVTVVNPDTKRSSKTGQQGFYYYGHPQSHPQIAAINPAQGSTAGGYTIDIIGSDFQDNGVNKTRVSINGVDVAALNTTVSVDGKKITVVVPPYPGDLWKDRGIGRLTVPVVIVNPDGASAGKEDGFTYLVPSSYPKILKIVPNQGSAAGGDIVEITGEDFRFFEPFEDLDRDKNHDANEPFSNLNHNQDANGLDSWDDFSRETVAGLRAKYGNDYDAIVTPVLPKVYFGSKQAVIEEFSSGYLKVLTPAGTAGTVDVYVVNNDSGLSNRLKFTYQGSNPKIDKIVPDQGKKQGRDNVEIYGSGFFDNQITVYTDQNTWNSVTMPLIRFGSITNQDIPREQPNSGRIDNQRTTVNLDGGLKVEYDASGTGKVTVQITEDKQTYQGIFTNYDGSVRFVDLSQLVNINQAGQKYPGYELLRLEINDRRLLVERGYSPYATLLRSTQVSLKTPSYFGVGKVAVTIVNPDGGTATGQYEYKNPDSHPVIINITRDGNAPENEPYQGKTVKIVRLTCKGGNIVSIIGQDFRENAVIQISNILKIEPSAITYILPGRLTFTMPAVNKTEAGKLHRLMVINEDGASAASDQALPPIYLQFIEGTTGPRIDKITPAQGPASGGTAVKIEGNDFRSGLKVYFGETPVPSSSVTVVDYKTILVVAPANSPGKVGVKVENPDGELSTPVEFTYLSCPKVIAVVDPADPTENTRITSISVEGGEEIKIKGAGFMPGARVVFNPVLKKAENDSPSGNVIYLNGVPYILQSGTEGSDCRFIDAETITVKTPAGKVDTKGLIVINKDQGASEPYDNVVYGLPQLKAPAGVVAELVYDRYIKIHWSAVEGASYYEIYASIDDQLEFLDSTTRTDFMYSDLEPRTRYTFIIKAVGNFGSSKPSAESNSVRTGRVVGPPDDDGDLDDHTTQVKSGTTATVTIGTDDNRSQVTIDLTRGTLAGCQELVISLPAAVIEDGGPELMVYGPDYALRFNPRVFNLALRRSSYSQSESGVRLTISPYQGSLYASGGNNLSRPYNIKADVFTGKSSSPVDLLAGIMSLTLDFDAKKSEARRLDQAALCRYNEYNQTWDRLNLVNSNQTTAVSAAVNRMGLYVVLGSRR
jgi:hypothetical protein